MSINQKGKCKKNKTSMCTFTSGCSLPLFLLWFIFLHLFSGGQREQKTNNYFGQKCCSCSTSDILTVSNTKNEEDSYKWDKSPAHLTNNKYPGISVHYKNIFTFLTWLQMNLIPSFQMSSCFLLLSVLHFCLSVSVL